MDRQLGTLGRALALRHDRDLKEKLCRYIKMVRQYNAEERNDGAYGNRTNLEFDIKEKTIPAVIEGLALRKDRLQERLADYDKCEPYFHGLEHEIEKHFDKAMTAKGFEAMRDAVADRLMEYAAEVMRLKARKS